MNLRILHVVHQLGAAAAGVSAVVQQLAEAQRVLGNETRFFTTRGRGLVDALSDAWREVGWAQVVHVHALWISSTWIGSHAAMLRRRPYVLTPHGMLDPWALAHSAWKKRIARLLAEDRIISRAGRIHCLCEAEASAVRRLGFTAPVSIVPPGLGSPWAQVPEPCPSDPPFVLFLGRIHPKKGIDLLIDGFGAATRTKPEWRLIIAGPDEVGLQAYLAARARAAGVESRVVFAGPVQGNEKLALLRSAALFALTSHSEGLPVAALEAMACGVPVALTRACNLPHIEAHGAGFLGDDNPESVAVLMDRALSLTTHERRAQGQAARVLFLSRFTNGATARALQDVYVDAIEGNSR